jgi:hypothetical protein
MKINAENGMKISGKNRYNVFVEPLVIAWHSREKDRFRNIYFVGFVLRKL